MDYLVPLCVKVSETGNPSLDELVMRYARDEYHHDRYSVSPPSSGIGIWNFFTSSGKNFNSRIAEGVLPTNPNGTNSLSVSSYTSNQKGTSFKGVRARGVTGSPEGVQANDSLVSLSINGYVAASGFVDDFVIEVLAAQDWIVGNTPTKVRILTIPTSASAGIERLCIASNGSVGINHASPQHSLDVSGYGNFSQGIYIAGNPVGTGGGEANTASNLGAGSGLFSSKNGFDLRFKSLRADSNFLITGDSQELFISFVGPYASTNYVNSVSGDISSRLVATGAKIDSSGAFIQIQLDTISGSLNTKIENTGSLLQSQVGGPKVTGISVNFGNSNTNGINFLQSGNITLEFSGSNTIVIGSSAGTGVGGGEANTASNLGAGEGLFSDKNGVDLRFKSLVAGSGITITSNTSEVTINRDSPWVFPYLTATQTFTNQAAALTELATAPRYVWDLSSYSQARYSIYTSTQGSPSARIGLQYSNDATNWTGFLPEWATVSGGATATTRITDWQTIPELAKYDKIFRIVSVSGDGVADPIVRGFSVQFR